MDASRQDDGSNIELIEESHRTSLKPKRLVS